MSGKQQNSSSWDQNDGRQNVFTMEARWAGSTSIERMLLVHTQTSNKIKIDILSANQRESTEMRMGNHAKSMTELVATKIEIFSSKLIKFRGMAQALNDFIQRDYDAGEFESFLGDIERKTNQFLGIRQKGDDIKSALEPEVEIIDLTGEDTELTTEAEFETIDLTGDDPSEGDSIHEIRVEKQPLSEEDFFSRGEPFKRGVPQDKRGKK